MIDFSLSLVFANVLLEQLGLPIPAMPTMIAAAGSAVESRQSPLAVFAVALVACTIGDGVWYLLGRRYGTKVLRLLCGISLSPDSCVRQTSLHFERWGAWTLVLAKFLPGLGAVVPPLAGVMRMGWVRFLVLSGAGSALWAGISVLAGAVMHAQVSELLARLQALGPAALALVGGLVALYVAFKYWERQRFYKTIRMARITADELRALIAGKQEPVIVDLRARAERARDGRSIPGARVLDLDEVDRQAAQFPRDRDIVFFCSCPNEASAASAAKALMDLGYTRVRPLLGGLEAWADAGYDVEDVSGS